LEGSISNKRAKKNEELQANFESKSVWRHEILKEAPSLFKIHPNEPNDEENDKSLY
jgi:hypothetical protein